MSALTWSPTAAASRAYADDAFCSSAKSIWFRVRSKEVEAGRRMPASSSILPAAWTRTSVGVQLLELRIVAEGHSRLPCDKEMEAVEQQLDEAVADLEIKVNSVRPYLRFREVNNSSDHVADNTWLKSIRYGIWDGACVDAIAEF
ncbi:hypothetical protein FVE85_5165 [Porphyridium purpureum]|uniref:Uncharacterized protein n=1 Tax=Porphyridium purpureum TaxID=35688 RepID=A0A5J4Z2R2_PORPP|nr:hypothetical protein FVE85_5165 [Porphyridium purpureum]|eukprot:POR5456..scf295_1